eukprot:14627751-Alexandrium_andersonii.AAC.1
MSASLVGSEMCIRDRYQNCPLDVLRGQQRAPPGTRLGTAQGHGKIPVSYTHLTLPTICSV